MSKLSDIAKKTVGGGGLTGGLEKIKLDEVIKAYPDGVSVTGAELINASGSTFPVFTFVENTAQYFSGGKALREMVEAWIEEYDGDLSTVNDDLKAEPVRIKMKKVTTKGGKTFTTVTILGTLQPVEDISEPQVDYDAETGELSEDSPF